MANAASVSFLAIAAGALGYCFYFDYQRRNNAEFRKQLYLKKRQAEKEEKASKQKSKEQLKATLKLRLSESLTNDPLTEGGEEIFVKEITIAEQLCKVPGKEIDAAIHFYRALSVYAQPAAILSIYQKSVPAEIFDLIMALCAILPPANIAAALNASETD